MTPSTPLQRNHVNVAGCGPRTLLFGHGYGCEQNIWRAITPHFESEYRIVLFDHVGSGRSDPAAFSRARYSTLAGYAHDLLEIIAELELPEVDFVGHSVGSMIGALASVEQPNRFRSLTMIGPSPCYLNDGEYRGGFERGELEELLSLLESNHFAWAATMAPLLMRNGDAPALTAELEASFCSTDPAFAQHFARVTFLSDSRAVLPKVQTRTLILQCQADIVAPLSVGAYMHGAMPHSELAVLRAEGHCPHVSAPAEVVDALRRFL